MKIILSGLKITGAVVLLIVCAAAVNILQKGGAYSGRPMHDILGAAPEKADLNNLLRLSKSEFIQLYYAAPAPAPSDMTGEFSAVNHPGGILGPVVQLYTDHFFGPGRWAGKGFSFFKNNEGQGYNLFKAEGIIKARKMKTFMGVSVFDKKDSFHLLYKPHNNDPVVNSMRDEIRKINNNLYIGLGYMALGGGSVNPSPFILYR